MNRRQFTLRLGAAGAAPLLAMPVWAQGEPVEGKDYLRLQQPVPVSPGPGKVEVVEFFGYWCPHCNAFEPVLDAWARKLPPEVVFRRIPVAFSAAHDSLQRLYLALEALGQVDAMHRKVFAAVHVQHQRLDKDAEIAALMSANGVDGAKVVEAMKSFSVVARVKQMRQLAESYRIDGVPTLGVQGRYLTTVGMAGGHDRALQIVDALVRKAKAG